MPAVLRKGSRLGKYRLDRRIGEGAFASVWKARDMVEKRSVALKVTHPESVKQWGREDIEHEARIASRLHHPNVVAVRNADWFDGRFVMATDLASCSLASYPRARRSGRVALQIIREVAAGLAYAHRHRVMHRDVKLENVMIFPDGRAALGDFGASRFAKRASQTYTEAGTLGYMAPEQAYGRPRLGSDVFSVGLIAYEMLTGVLPMWPFEWPPPHYDRFVAKVPEPVRAVLHKAGEFEPSRRYPDGVAFREALERAFARAEATPRSARAPRRRRKVPAPSPLKLQAELFRRTRGKDLELRYSCHRCEGPVSESMAHCPWCGTGDNSFREITRHNLVCPECERGVRPEWKFCPWCYKGRFVGNGRVPPPDPRAVRACSARGCDAFLRPFMRYCPKCKQKPRRPWSHPGLPDRCPRCRWPTSRSFMRFCPWCGRHEPRAGSFSKTK